MGKFERALQDERLMNFLGIDDEDKKELLKMHKEQKEKNILKNDRSLKINDRLDRIYIDKDVILPILKKFNDNKNPYSFRDCLTSGYVFLDLHDLFEIELPDENEVLRLIQEHDEPEMLENISNSRNRIYKDFSQVIIYYELKGNIISKLKFYNQNTKEIIAEQKDELEVTKVFTSQAPYKVDCKIELEETDDGYSVSICDVPEIIDTVMYISAAILLVSFTTIVNGSVGDYRITKDNLNEIIPKNNNENIHLNRELKQIIKKYNSPIYYVRELK